MERKLILESRNEEVVRAEKIILRDAAEHGFDGTERFAIQLALEEALTNAIKHGNRSDPSKRVTVEYEVDEEGVRIRVSDEGEGFDPGTVPDPTLDENLAKPYGRGVMLMRTYMSEVAYNEQGNCVTMTMRRGAASGA